MKIPKLQIRTADALAALACAGVVAIGVIAFVDGRVLIRKNAEIAASLAQAQLSLGEVQARLARIEQQTGKSARIRLLFPELTDSDLASLSEPETSLAPLAASARTASFERKLSPAMATPHVVSAEGPYSRYFSTAKAEVKIGPALPTPGLEITDADSLYPTVRITGTLPSRHVNFYFEFDTSSDFDSPNFWRSPALIPSTFPPDLTGRAGLGYNLFQSHIHGVETPPVVRFPFRVTAMALPMAWDSIEFGTLAKFSQLLAYGLEEEAAKNEIYAVNRQRVVYSDETAKRNPLDTFKAGLGECIHANELMGEMLEINGYRYRTVGGFNPTFRNAYPGGGHAAIEVLNGKKWEYMDPYLDHHVPGLGMIDFSHHPVGKALIARVDRSKFPSEQIEDLTLGNLFRYRLYSDAAGRLPPATMFQLVGAEDRYGRDWELRKLLPDERLDIDRDLPKQVQIHVRARYIATTCVVSQGVSCVDPLASASPWAQANFTIDPVKLLRQQQDVVELPRR
jgi:hypothetical protein